MNVGFIGLGVMGRAMAKNLLKAGHAVAGYDIVPTAIDTVVAAGAQRGESPKDVAARAEVIVLMLPDAPDVETALSGPEGALSGAAPGTIAIDMSSVKPEASRRFAAACAAKGVGFLDAPVSGGEPKAIDGTLAIMVGGDADVLKRARPLLEAMGSTVTHTGPVGAGNVTKLANQIMVAGNIAAMGEALVLAAKAGLDPEVVFKAVRVGLAGSTVLDAKAPMVYTRDFKPGARMTLHEKDLHNALDTADSLGVPLPLTRMAHQMMCSLIEAGKASLDHSALVQYTEQAAGIEVKRPEKVDQHEAGP
jgi:2-hydroxy-3-oxopropionate reductase